MTSIITDRQHPVLRGVAEPMNTDDPFYVFDTVKKLKDKAKSTPDCAGLAAPQIGLPIRLFTVKIEGAFEVFINPEIVEFKDVKQNGWERCLSVPEGRYKVKRYKRVRIKWINEHGVSKVRTFGGFVARCIQHEYDHLDGKLIGKD